MRDIRGLIDRKLSKIKQLQSEIDILNAAANLLHDESDNGAYNANERRAEAPAKPNGRAPEAEPVVRFP